MLLGKRDQLCLVCITHGAHLVGVRLCELSLALRACALQFVNVLCRGTLECCCMLSAHLMHLLLCLRVALGAQVSERGGQRCDMLRRGRVKCTRMFLIGAVQCRRRCLGSLGRRRRSIQCRHCRCFAGRHLELLARSRVMCTQRVQLAGMRRAHLTQRSITVDTRTCHISSSTCQFGVMLHRQCISGSGVFCDQCLNGSSVFSGKRLNGSVVFGAQALGHFDRR
jgi:hypothetical protein